MARGRLQTGGGGIIFWRGYWVKGRKCNWTVRKIRVRKAWFWLVFSKDGIGGKRRLAVYHRLGDKTFPAFPYSSGHSCIRCLQTRLYISFVRCIHSKVSVTFNFAFSSVFVNKCILWERYVHSPFLWQCKSSGKAFILKE